MIQLETSCKFGKHQLVTASEGMRMVHYPATSQQLWKIASDRNTDFSLTFRGALKSDFSKAALNEFEPKIWKLKMDTFPAQSPEVARWDHGDPGESQARLEASFTREWHAISISQAMPKAAWMSGGWDQILVYIYIYYIYVTIFSDLNIYIYIILFCLNQLTNNFPEPG